MSDTDFDSIIAANYPDDLTEDAPTRGERRVMVILAVIAILAGLIALATLATGATLLIAALTWAIIQTASGHADAASNFVLVFIPLLAVVITVLAVRARLGRR